MAGDAAGGMCVKETGIVRKWDAVWGYGFIQSDTLKNDYVFIHIKSLMRVGLDSLRIGQKVRFNVVPGRTRQGGICAEDIELSLSIIRTAIGIPTNTIGECTCGLTTPHPAWSQQTPGAPGSRIADELAARVDAFITRLHEAKREEGEALRAGMIAVAASRTGDLSEAQRRAVRNGADATYEGLADLAEKFDALCRALSLLRKYDCELSWG